MSTLWQDIKTQFIQSPSIVVRIIFINLAIFIVTFLLNTVFYLGNVPFDHNIINDYLGVSANIHTVLTHPWTIITYGFIHSGILHVAFNMLVLYWFGNIFTEFLGNKKFLPLFLLGIIAGAFLFILIYNVAPAFHASVSDATMVGASAGILAIVVAAATLLPDYTVFLILIGPVKLKWLALVMVLIDMISIPFGNAGGHIAHLGGALMGYIYIKQLRNGNDLGKWLNAFFDWVTTLFSSRQKIKIVSSNTSSSYTSTRKSEPTDTQHQEKLDRILDKISHSGYESLSKEEKDFLFSYSKKDN